MGRFTYFPYIIVLMISELIGALLLLYYLRIKQRNRNEQSVVASILASYSFQSIIHNIYGNNDSTNDINTYSSNVEDCRDHSIIDTSHANNTDIDDYGKVSEYKFETTFLGIGNSRICSYILCFTRFCCLLFFIVVAIGINLSRESFAKEWYFFTNWNVLLIAVYYSIAFTLSCIGIYYSYYKSGTLQSPLLCSSSGSSNVKWSSSIQTLGKYQIIIFDYAGATAMLITVVAFTLLDPQFVFFNCTVHFATTLSFLLEMMINSLHVRLAHLSYSLIWYTFYLIIIWTVVYTSAVPDWPYPFLRTDSYACFFWYTALLFCSCLFYGLWMFMSKCKHYIKKTYFHNSYTSATYSDGRSIKDSFLRDNVVFNINSQREFN